MKEIHFQLDDETYTKLKSLCAYQGQQSHIIRTAIKRFIKGIEDAAKSASVSTTSE